MNDKQWIKLNEHHKQAKVLREQVENTQKLIRGMTLRAKEDPVRVAVYYSRNRSPYDQGCYTLIPSKTVVQAILPALRAALADAKKQLADLQPLPPASPRGSEPT